MQWRDSLIVHEETTSRSVGITELCGDKADVTYYEHVGKGSLREGLGKKQQRGTIWFHAM